MLKEEDRYCELNIEFVIIDFFLNTMMCVYFMIVLLFVL